MVPLLLPTMHLRGKLFPLRMNCYAHAMHFGVSWNMYHSSLNLHALYPTLSIKVGVFQIQTCCLEHHTICFRHCVCYVFIKLEKFPTITCFRDITIGFVDPKVNGLYSMGG